MRSLSRIIVEIGRAIRFELLSTIGTLLTIALAAIMPGAAWVASKNISIIENDLKNNMTIDVFLRENAENIDIADVGRRLGASDGIKAVQFISKDEALQRMRKSFGPEMLQGIDVNPLPASFSLKADQSIFDSTHARTLIDRISAFPEVEDVVFAGGMVNRIGKILRTVEIIGLAISILVALAGVFIVANIIRVAINDRKKTIEVMQLLGATRGYILSPFVILGGLLGLLGTGLAGGILIWLYKFISKNLMNIYFIEPLEFVVFLMIGLLLGMTGAFIATRKYLKI